MPNRFMPLNPGSSLPDIIAQINKNFAALDNESVTKKFGQGDESVIIGKKADGTIGLSFSQEGGDEITIGRGTDGSIGLRFRDQAGVEVLVGKKADGSLGVIFTDPDDKRIKMLGNYAANRYGLLSYEAGTPVELDGQHPVDGHHGHWIVKPGLNVITALGG